MNVFVIQGKGSKISCLPQKAFTSGTRLHLVYFYLSCYRYLALKSIRQV